MLGSQVVILRSELKRSDVGGHIAAFVDMMLLAECDAIVSTQMSTFSYVAHALAGKEPWMVNFQGACVRDISSQPCLHAWRCQYPLSPNI